MQVLRGARDVLAHTHVVICEADMDDFQALNQTLVDAGFGLFNVTQPNWLEDRTLGWFYPVICTEASTTSGHGHFGTRGRTFKPSRCRRSAVGSFSSSSTRCWRNSARERSAEVQSER